MSLTKRYLEITEEEMNQYREDADREHDESIETDEPMEDE